jgi:DNA repair protein RadC
MKEDIREVLAYCLREDSNGYVVNSLLREFPTIQDLFNADEGDLRVIKGIGAVKAKQLRAIVTFVKMVNSPDTTHWAVIRSPQDVFDIMRGDMEFLQVEEFAIIGLSTKNHVLFNEVVSTGTLNASLVHPREVFKSLIKRSCGGVILVHNHPSGFTEPSTEDISLTKKLVEAGKLLEIPVLDHVIIGRGKYLSFKEKGLL